ncbi:SusC/RagA family TonB-linked outer membrane protein [Pedobacter sp. PF22-3]|uniref:SusC/RagA family TonB-linked outer membrane protein n=1 Tax=Pedobacter sp. PF22-3 TaxID=2994467 RepID=UPI002245F649|nr:SusC/RagA family TonB-linked outer membrane protein [Pedobacter sp. PF22-3]MCX2494649.1 SusC/RagA family TonB-linked outer membrane protein [Pedobacter sp. PF22-3]
MNDFLFFKEYSGRMSGHKINGEATTNTNSLLSFRWIIILFFLFALSFSNQLYAQTVTLDLKNATIIKATTEIRKQTKYDFTYNDLILKKAKPVTLKLVKEPLNSALKKLFAGQDLDYEIKDRIIIITEKKASVATDADKALDGPVTGSVTNEYDKPMEGVTVRVKGTKFYTQTDKSGHFTIPGQYSTSLLEINHLGYHHLEIPAQRARVVSLKISASELKDIVVNTGYQQIDSRQLTSAITSIKVEDLLTPGVNTIDKLLEGRVPGLVFMQNSGQVGAAPKLRIRGTSTILGNREPLWVLDGIVLQDPVNIDPKSVNDLDFVNLLGNAIAGLNPEDIDQIDVLKDASATALYGAKAGNGVIVITTKKGKPGKATISYSANTTFNRRPRYSDRNMNMMNSEERMDVSKEMVERRIQYNNVTQFSGYEDALQKYYKGTIDYNEFKRQSDYYAGVNTDWLGLITQDSYSQNHTLTLSGGSNRIKFYSSLGYLDEQGTIKGEYNKRYSSVVNVTADYDQFLAQVSFAGNYSSRNYSPSDLGIMNYAYNTSRTLPAYNPDGSYFYYPVVINGSRIFNYNILKDRNYSSDHTDLIASNLKALVRLKITPKFNVEGTFAYAISNNDRQLYYTKDSYYIGKLRNDFALRNDMAPVGGEWTKNETRNNNYTGRLQANYATTFGAENRHSLTISGGTEIKSNEYNGFDITRRGYFPEMGGYFDIVPTSYTGYYNQWMSTKAALGSFNRQLTNEFAWYGTTGYSYRDKYIFNFNIRGEKSNLFGTRSNNKLLPIYAFSGRWNMKEDVARNTSWVSDLSLKGSWGWQGNMLPGQSPYMIIKQNPATDPYYNSSSANIVNYPNPDLKWERTSSSNIALDFALFGNKVSGSIGYFYKRTQDAFLNKTVSEINGVQSYVINSGTIENKGVEVALSVTAINNVGMDKSKRGFVWRFDPQLGQVLNKIINQAINNRNNVLIDNINYSNYLSGNIQLAGKPINTFYSYKFKGLSPVDGSPIFYGLEEKNSAAYQQRYLNMDRQDIYLEIMSESGRREPFIQGGLSNYFGYRNFGLSFNLTYSLGNKIRLMKIASGYATTSAYPQQNLRKEFVDRWRRPGDELYTNIPGLQVSTDGINPWWQNYPVNSLELGGSAYEMYDDSDVRLVSGDYLKLQSASFRYSFSESVMRKLKLSSAYVSLTGTNLFTITNKMLKGQDPTQSGATPNINLSIRPTYTASINVSF